jgi:hypothetical protein
MRISEHTAPDPHTNRNSVQLTASEVATEDRTIKNRVTFNLNARGEVVSIDMEDAAVKEIHQTAIVQTHNLLHKINELIWALANTPVTTFVDEGNSDVSRASMEGKVEGYTAAMLQIKSLPQIEAARNAVQDLRHYLTITPATAMEDARKKIQHQHWGGR